MPLDLMLVAGIVVAATVVLGAVLIWKRRAGLPSEEARIAEALAARGWVPLVGGASPEWAVLEPLAVLGPHSQGRPRALELRVFKDPAAKVARCAAVAKVGEQDDSEAMVRTRLIMLQRSFWIGEVRPTRQQQPGTVWDYSWERIGESAMELFAKLGGIELDEIRRQAAPPPGEPARALRALLESEGVGHELKATLHIHSDAWVLTAPLDAASPRFERLLNLAGAISATIDQAR